MGDTEETFTHDGNGNDEWETSGREVATGEHETLVDANGDMEERQVSEHPIVASGHQIFLTDVS